MFILDDRSEGAIEPWRLMFAAVSMVWLFVLPLPIEHGVLPPSPVGDIVRSVGRP